METATDYRKLEDALTHEMIHLRDKIENLGPENTRDRAIYKTMINSYDRILKEIAD